MMDFDPGDSRCVDNEYNKTRDGDMNRNLISRI